jgi:hypothetical protein
VSKFDRREFVVRGSLDDFRDEAMVSQRPAEGETRDSAADNQDA